MFGVATAAKTIIQLINWREAAWRNAFYCSDHRHQIISVQLKREL